MSTKKSNRSYIGDPVLTKNDDENQNWVFTSNFIWAEKGGGAPCSVVDSERTIFFFEENPNSVRTNHIKFNTAFRVYTDSNYPDIPCDDLSGQQDVYFGVWYDDTITDEEINRQTEILGGPWQSDGSLYFPGDITQFVTQPKDDNYTGKIYVILRHGTGYIGGSGEFSDYQYEVKL